MWDRGPSESWSRPDPRGCPQPKPALGTLSTDHTSRRSISRRVLNVPNVRSRQREEAFAAQVVGERLGYLLGDHRPRRAVTQPEPARPVSAPDMPDEPEAADPDSLRSRAAEAAVPSLPRFNRLHVAVVCSLLVLGLVLAVIALLRARPVALASPQTTITSSTSQPSLTSFEPSARSSPAPEIVVHVVGAVRRPGLVHLPERSRVSDAIDAAGGLGTSAALGELNLAQVLSDGQQIVIGSRSHPGGEVRQGGEASAADGTTNPGSTGQLDLNSATAAQLDTLPGVGPVTAERILSWRKDHERFRRIEELQEVDGIGPKTYSQIAPHVRV